MDNKQPRSLTDIVADLTKAADNIQVKKKSLDKATEAVSRAAAEFDDAQIATTRLRAELEESLNLLVAPNNVQSRVRSSI